MGSDALAEVVGVKRADQLRRLVSERHAVSFHGSVIRYDQWQYRILRKSNTYVPTENLNFTFSSTQRRTTLQRRNVQTLDCC
jgi:hypothetical protein